MLGARRTVGVSLPSAESRSSRRNVAERPGSLAEMRPNSASSTSPPVLDL
jgi:hypothetical protein